MLALAAFAFVATVSSTQDPQPQKPDPATQQPGRRRRPEWKPTLALPTDLWTDVTAATIGDVGEWTNKVELADVDSDGRIDILFANGGDYDKAGTAVPSRVFQNAGPGARWPEITTKVFGDALFFARVIKVADVDLDGHADVFVGTTFQTQSRLFRGLGKGAFVDATTTHLPQGPLSVGDVEFGDVDGDGDLDLVLADWGPGSPMQNEGARPRLWTWDGTRFVDATEGRIPDWKVKFCWELEWIDVDQDFDLDLLVSSKRSPGSFLAHNDGTGKFTDASAKLPQFTNNYEFEAMDVDGDAVLDVVTINDGAGERRFTEHLFLGDGKGGFRDATKECWPDADNPRFDDNMIAFLDFDNDGDADFLIGSLDGPDRLLVNDGKGRFQAGAPVFAGDPTRGTLGIALADLDGDRRLDVVHAQGEVATASADKVFFGKSLAPDTRAPWLGEPEIVVGKAGAASVLRVRVHDRKGPAMPQEGQRVFVQVTQGETTVEVPAQWYGEHLWRAAFVLQPGAARIVLVAIDAAGNRATSESRTVQGS